MVEGLRVEQCRLNLLLAAMVLVLLLGISAFFLAPLEVVQHLVTPLELLQGLFPGVMWFGIC
jgi:hypothetical protein